METLVKNPIKAWRLPQKSASKLITGLKLRNSLTNQLNEFVPEQKNMVKMYNCGPTV
jgi:hypothetical protein